MCGIIRLSRPKAGTVLSLSASPHSATDHIEVTAAKHRRDVAANIRFGRYKLCHVARCLCLRTRFHSGTGGFGLESRPWLKLTKSDLTTHSFDAILRRCISFEQVLLCTMFACHQNQALLTCFTRLDKTRLLKCHVLTALSLP